MIALLTALLATVVVIMDYWWPHYEGRTTKPGQAKLIKHWSLIALIAVVWVLAGLQIHQNKKSDADIDYLKAQLAQANLSLTNSTAAVKGLTIGGDARATIGFAAADDTNALTASMWHNGDYPLRRLGIKITEETARLHAQEVRSTNVPPEGPVLYERFFGDVGTRTSCDLCTLHMDPTITNYYRFDVGALNGSYWEIIAFTKTNDKWAMRLVYKWGRFGDKVEMDPPEMRGKLLAY